MLFPKQHCWAPARPIPAAIARNAQGACRPRLNLPLRMTHIACVMCNVCLSYSKSGTVYGWVIYSLCTSHIQSMSHVQSDTSLWKAREGFLQATQTILILYIFA